MTTLSLFRSALGDAFDRLAPVLQRHYDLVPGQEVLVHGPMEAWNRVAWARAFAPFTPIPGQDILVRVRNRGLIDRGEVCYEWEREFRNPSGTTLSYTLTRPAPALPNGRPCVLDTFNRSADIAVTLALEVLDDGRALKQVTAGPQYALRGGRRIAIPGLGRITSEAVERALDERTIHTDVVVSHPAFGRLFGYTGTLVVG